MSPAPWRNTPPPKHADCTVCGDRPSSGSAGDVPESAVPKILPAVTRCPQFCAQHPAPPDHNRFSSDAVPSSPAALVVHDGSGSANATRSYSCAGNSDVTRSLTPEPDLPASPAAGDTDSHPSQGDVPVG